MKIKNRYFWDPTDLVARQSILSAVKGTINVHNQLFIPVTKGTIVANPGEWVFELDKGEYDILKESEIRKFNFKE